MIPSEKGTRIGRVVIVSSARDRVGDWLAGGEGTGARAVKDHGWFDEIFRSDRELSRGGVALITLFMAAGEIGACFTTCRAD
jgi:hypothetical protein